MSSDHFSPIISRARAAGQKWQAIGFAVLQQGYRVLYREAHLLLEELAEAQLDGTRKDYIARVTTVPLLIID